MNIHTKEFWQLVKEERSKHEVDLAQDYLCHCSITFQNAWRSFNDDLRDIADDFLVDSPQWNTIFRPGDIDSSVLFVPIDIMDFLYGAEDRQRRGVRDDFIEWNLKKCP